MDIMPTSLSILGRSLKRISLKLFRVFSQKANYTRLLIVLVSLIPKVQNPKSAKEYRTIACCTVVYKIISKVLTNRLHGVIQSVISDSQAGFIPGRKISDNILLAHKLVKAYTRKHISPRCMLKIDLQKAYDLVEWAFLEQVMYGLGFPEMFVQWVMNVSKL